MTRPVDEDSRLKLAACVRLRREHFGGLAYDPRSGDTVELDRGAFRLLELARGGVGLEAARAVILAERLDRRLPVHRIADVVRQLLGSGLLRPMGADEADECVLLQHRPVEDWPTGPQLSGPEAVHWAITYRCHGQCPDCYAARHRQSAAAELSTDDALRIVRRIAGMRPFQLAIGGGEPLLREDLAPITHEARIRGLSVHVTTGGDHIDRIDDGLLENITCLSVGVRHQDLLANPPTGQALKLREMSGRLARSHVALGANLILCRSVLLQLEGVLARLFEAGFPRVTLLRYKPPSTMEQWRAECPSGHELLGVEDRFAAFLEKNAGLALRLDCGLAFLERRLPPEIARSAGLRGCVAGTRILAVGCDGTAYPCSQLVHPRFAAGNLLVDAPADVWQRAPAMKRYRSRSDKRVFRETACGACLVRDRCGGCPALSDDGLGPDRGCPEPLLPLLQALGRDGRVADLRRFLDHNGSTTVAEYMERYGVGPKRAMAELRRFPELRLESGGTGRRKTDRYVRVIDDVIGDIQESIGTTSWGFPYATREQIAERIGASAETTHYPRWLSAPSADTASETLDFDPEVASDDDR
jgi:radical SAM protein with 4Fe4S-binding SPASM domain